VLGAKKDCHGEASRTKTYIVDPLRLTAADGGMYLTAWVDEYDESRHFAVERRRCRWRAAVIGRPRRA
jgi:predicted DNA-binding transcriptional regulator YafY